jgi:hypothetical protein
MSSFVTAERVRRVDELMRRQVGSGPPSHLGRTTEVLRPSSSVEAASPSGTMRAVRKRQVIGIALASGAAVLGAIAAVAAASTVSTEPPPAFVSPYRHGASAEPPTPPTTLAPTGVGATSAPDAANAPASDRSGPRLTGSSGPGPGGQGSGRAGGATTSTTVDDHRGGATTTSTTVDDHGGRRPRDEPPEPAEPAEPADPSDSSGSGSGSGSGK